MTGGDEPPLGSAAVREITEALNLQLEEDKVARLLDHLLLVRELNREINLVSRSSVERTLLASLWESLVAARLHWETGERLLDLGSGGGFPGLPLAIVLPGLHVTLLDSRRAKTLALKRILAELKMNPFPEVVHDRAETLAEHSDVRFDAVAVRAVGPLKEVAPWAERLLVPGGRLLAWKGPEGLKEFQSLPAERWKLQERLPVLPHRSILVLARV